MQYISRYNDAIEYLFTNYYPDQTLFTLDSFRYEQILDYCPILDIEIEIDNRYLNDTIRNVDRGKRVLACGN